MNRHALGSFIFKLFTVGWQTVGVITEKLSWTVSETVVSGLHNCVNLWLINVYHKNNFIHPLCVRLFCSVTVLLLHMFLHNYYSNKRSRPCTAWHYRRLHGGHVTVTKKLIECQYRETFKGTLSIQWLKRISRNRVWTGFNWIGSDDAALWTWCCAFGVYNKSLEFPDQLNAYNFLRKKNCAIEHIG
jgi:hypothetical protein